MDVLLSSNELIDVLSIGCF